MASTIDVQPIMDEIRRLAEERRRLLSAGQLPAGHLATSEDGKGTELPVAAHGSQADLLDPVLIVPWRKGLLGWSVRILRRLLQKFLKPTLSRQTAFNQAVMESLTVLGSRLQAAMQARQEVDQRTEQALETLFLRLEEINTNLSHIESRNEERIRHICGQ